MKYEAFKRIITERRSIRRFTEQHVTEEDIRELIDCARYAPSDTNSQTWKFTAVLNRNLIREIEQLTWDELHKRAAKQKIKV